MVLGVMPHQGARHGGLVNVFSWWHWHLRRSVPGADRLVEFHGPGEHGLHVCHGRSVPGADRLVEALGRAEHALHVCHGRSVPGADRLVEVVGFVEHVLHVLVCGFWRQPGTAKLARG